jgi:hypothetical protein
MRGMHESDLASDQIDCRRNSAQADRDEHGVSCYKYRGGHQW